MPITNIEGNLPAWKGASECYSKAYRILEKMAQHGHVKKYWKSFHFKNGDQYQCYPSADMTNLIDALNKGDKETIKGLLLQDYYMEYDK